MNSRTEKGIFDRIVLGFLSVSVLMGKAYQNTLQAMDSSTYARLALDSTRGPGLRLPIGDARLGEGFWPTGFNDHPFTLIWLSGKIMRWLGPDAFSARLLASALGVVAVLAVYQFGVSVVKSRPAGYIGALLLISTPMFVSYSARFQLDPAMLAGIALSFVGYFTSSFLLTLAGVALAVWVKGPLGFLVYPSAFIAILVTRRSDFKEWKKFAVYSAAGLAVGSLIWIAIGMIGSWDLVADYWGRWVFGQIAKNSYSPNLGTFAFLLKRNFLWLGWLGAILFIAKRRKLIQEFAFVGTFAGGLIIFVLVFSMQSKFEHYYLPCFLAFSMAGCFAFRNWAERRILGIRSVVSVLAIVVPSVLLATPVPLSPEMFPQLRRWIPFIQRHGTCRDRILLVEDGVPYGSARDYAAVLQFYTNRPTYGVSGCESLRREVSGAAAPVWIIVNDALFSECLSGKIPAPYLAEFRYGNQILLGPVDLSGGPVDLSFLEGELRAVADCEIPNLSPNRYFRPH